MKALALTTDEFTHHLDHLAPLCALSNIPIQTDCPIQYKMLTNFYPMVTSRFAQFNFQQLTEEFDTFILSTKDAQKELRPLIGSITNKTIRFIFCPHGRSEKYDTNSNLSPYKDQDIALIYHTNQIDLFKKQKIYHTINQVHLIGDYRLAFYTQYRRFYEHLTCNLLSKSFKKKQPLILYTPTWNDMENSSSFFNHIQDIITNLPDHFNLLIKIHPLLYKYHIEQVIYHTRLEKGNCSFLFDFPPIYPLLNATKTYVGDASSIGYDFLTQNKQLFFLKTPSTKTLRIHASGALIDTSQDLYKQINPKKNRNHSSLYNNFFNPYNKLPVLYN